MFTTIIITVLLLIAIAVLLYGGIFWIRIQDSTIMTILQALMVLGAVSLAGLGICQQFSWIDPCKFDTIFSVVGIATLGVALITLTGYAIQMGKSNKKQ